jgi:hypothetical protein
MILESWSSLLIAEVASGSAFTSQKLPLPAEDVFAVNSVPQHTF